MGLLKSLIRQLTGKKREPLTQEQQDIVEQIAVIQPIINDDFKK